MKIRTRLLTLALLPLPVILSLSVIAAQQAASDLRSAGRVVLQTEQLSEANRVFQTLLRRRDAEARQITDQSRGLEALLFGDDPFATPAAAPSPETSQAESADAAAVLAFEQRSEGDQDAGLARILKEVREASQLLRSQPPAAAMAESVARYSSPLQRFAELPTMAASLAGDGDWGQRFIQLAGLIRLQEALAEERLLMRHALTTLEVEPGLGRVLAAAESRIATERSNLAASAELAQAPAAVAAALQVADKTGRENLLTAVKDYAQRVELEAQLIESLGYGGFIQSFKDYQLRGDPGDLARARTKLASAQQTLLRIAAVPMASPEQADVAAISAALAQFQTQLEKSGGQFRQISAIPRAQVENTVAALQRLHSFRPALSADSWDSGEVKLLATVASSIEQTLALTAVDARAEQARLKQVTLAGTAAVLLTLFLIVFAGRQMYRRLNGGIGALLQEFQRVASTGDVKTRRVVDGNDELAELNQYFERVGESLELSQAESARARQLSLAQLEVLTATRASGELNIIAAAILRSLREQSGAVIGAFYCFHESHTELIATAGLPSGHDLAATETGRGLVALVREADGTRVLEGLPAGFLRLAAASGVADAPALSLTPLKAFGKVVGAIELAWLSAPSNEARELLDRVAEPIGIVLVSSLNRARTETLLDETREQAERLQQQQEELRTSNEELAEQAAVLRQSEEELKSQREELQTTNEELEETAQILERQSAQLEQTSREVERATRYKSEFLANMSHELRTPLNSLLILAKQLAQNSEGNLNPDQVQSAQIIHGGGLDLLTLINDILDLSKVEAGKMDLHVDGLALENLVADLRRQFTPLSRERGVELLTEIDPELPAEILTDRNRLQQVLRNLLANSFKFTSKGHVCLRVSRPPPGMVLKRISDRSRAIAFTVEDTGIGIAGSKLGEIFEAFRQADGATNRKYGGTGLGLSIARQLSQLLGGEVQVSSEEGVGSAFTIIVPERMDNPAQDSSEPMPAPAALTAPAPSRRLEIPPAGEIAPVMEDDRSAVDGSKRSILVIEDDLKFAAIVRDLVRRQGFRCLVAGDGRSGLALAKKYQPGAIILDLHLPDSEGLSVLETLKWSGATRHIPVHIVSASEPTTEPLRQGAIGFLRKPVEASELIEVLARLDTQISREQRTVLLIEDDRASQVAVRKLLENDQTRVLVAASGSAAIELLGREQIDCIVLDLSLPDTDGIVFLEQLRSDERFAHPPVVVYTGRELSASEHRRLSEFAQSIVIKGAASPERLLDEVVLFLHEVEDRLPEPQRHIVSRLHHGSDAFAGKKLLVVDDDLRNSFALSSVLKQRGFEVLVADNGQLALDRLAEHSDIDAVLMDLMMPVMDGIEAMRQIRANPQHKSLPVIALTARAMGDDRRKCLDAGASDYLSKPVDIDQLLAMLRVWLGRSL